MGGKFTYRDTSYELQECISCGVAFAMPSIILDQDRKKGGFRYCPNGHQQGWGKHDSEEEKTRRERDLLKQQLAQKDDEIAAERRRTEEARQEIIRANKETKRLKKRAAAGTCPCCQRTVSQMSRHMKTKHPEFVTEEITNVVAMKASK